MARFLDLPTELIQEVVVLVPDDGVALASTCHRLAAIVQPLLFASVSLSTQKAAQIWALFRIITDQSAPTEYLKQLVWDVTFRDEEYILPDPQYAFDCVMRLLGPEAHATGRANWLEVLFDTGRVTALYAAVACSAVNLEVLKCSMVGLQPSYHHPLVLIFQDFGKLACHPFRKLRVLDAMLDISSNLTIPYLPCLEQLLIREGPHQLKFDDEWKQDGNGAMFRELHVLDGLFSYWLACRFLEHAHVPGLMKLVVRETMCTRESQHGKLALLLDRFPGLQSLDLDIVGTDTHYQDELLQISLRQLARLRQLRHLAIDRDFIFPQDDLAVFERLYSVLPPRLETLTLRGFPANITEPMLDEGHCISNGLSAAIATVAPQLQEVRMVVDVDLGMHDLLTPHYVQHRINLQHLQDLSQVEKVKVSIDLRHIGGPHVHQYPVSSVPVIEFAL